MTESRALPVDQAVALIRTWAELDWPVTREQTLALRDQLGWISSPDHEEFFTTNLGFGHEDAGVQFYSENGDLPSVDFRLSSLAGIENDSAADDLGRRIFGEYDAALSVLWGAPVKTLNRGVSGREWILPTGL